jgi:hypothetical protein
MTATLTELLDPQTVEEIYSQLLGFYAEQGFPTSAWQPFGTDRTRTAAIATVLADISANYLPSIAAGGLLDYAALLSNPGWLQLLASNNFSVTFNPATHTIGDILLTCAASAGPYTIAAGDLIAVFGATGNRYICNEGGTLATSGTLTLSFTAETAGAEFNDASSSGALTLSTPLPGVTLTNPAGDYTDVAQVGAGTGTLTLGGSPVGPHQIVVRIDSTGASGVASWSYAIDGAPYESAGAVASATNLGGYGINVTLVNGGSGTSFVLDDTYLFNTPGSWITTQGSDIETSLALATRCRNRWASLSSIPTEGFYEGLAQTVPDVGSQVTQVIVIEDADINNKVNIIVSGPEGVLPPATIALIQTYIDPRAIGTDFPTVTSPSELDIEIGGTVTVLAANLATAMIAIAAALNTYVNQTQINGTLRIAAIIEIIMEVPGVVDVSDVTINGSTSNVTLGSSVSFVVPRYTDNVLGWVTE